MAQYTVGCGRYLTWRRTETGRPSPSGRGRRVLLSSVLVGLFVGAGV